MNDLAISRPPVLGPLQPVLDETWRPSEIEEAK